MANLNAMAAEVLPAKTLGVTVTNTPGPPPAVPDFTNKNTGRTSMATKTYLSKMVIS